MENIILMTCFIIFAVLTAVAMLIMSYICSYKSKDTIKSSTYECGIEPKTSAKVSFNIAYFKYLVLFLLFESSSIFLYPLFACYEEFSKTYTIIILLYLVVVLISLLKIIRGYKI